MKQLNSKLSGDHSPMESLKSPSRRRLMGQVVLGGAAALVLTACGGGSGSDSSSDPKDLVAAFDRLKFGMTWAEAKSAVGWEPNGGNSAWTHNGYLLNCQVEFAGHTPILAWASLSSASSGEVTRNFR